MLAMVIIKLHDNFDLKNAKADVLIRANGKKIYRKHMKIFRVSEENKAVEAVEKNEYLYNSDLITTAFDGKGSEKPNELSEVTALGK